jgi:hypothetical protein
MTLRVVEGDEKKYLKCETVKDPRKTTLARTSSIRKGQTRSLVTKSRPKLSKSNKYLVMSPRWDSTPRVID